MRINLGSRGSCPGEPFQNDAQDVGESVEVESLGSLAFLVALSARVSLYPLFLDKRREAIGKVARERSVFVV
jgi:hypothetical protein